VRRTLLDLAGRAPEGWVVHDAARLAGGLDPGTYVAAVRRGTDARNVDDPILRLYRAALGRSPQPAELRAWRAIRRKGVPMAVIAQVFVTSPEFGRLHGALSNRQFAAYLAGLGRAEGPDPLVVSTWVALLDSGRVGRGRALAITIDATAYRADAQPWVDVVALWLGLLGRAPSPTEATTAIRRLAAGTPLSALATDLLSSPEYTRHITTTR